MMDRATAIAEAEKGLRAAAIMRTEAVPLTRSIVNALLVNPVIQAWPAEALPFGAGPAITALEPKPTEQDRIMTPEMAKGLLWLLALQSQPLRMRTTDVVFDRETGESLLVTVRYLAMRGFLTDAVVMSDIDCLEMRLTKEGRAALLKYARSPQ